MVSQNNGGESQKQLTSIAGTFNNMPAIRLLSEEDAMPQLSKLTLQPQEEPSIKVEQPLPIDENQLKVDSKKLSNGSGEEVRVKMSNQYLPRDQGDEDDKLITLCSPKGATERRILIEDNVE